MSNIEQKMKALLIAKMENGEEPKLTMHIIESASEYMYIDGKIAINQLIRNNVSEETLKELWALQTPA